MSIALAFPGERELADAVARQARKSGWDTGARRGAAAWCRFLRELLAGAEPAAAWGFARESGEAGSAGDAGRCGRAALLAVEGGGLEQSLARLAARGGEDLAAAPLAGAALALRQGEEEIPARWRGSPLVRHRLARAAARLARVRHEAIYRDLGAPPMAPGRTLGALFTGRHPLTDLDAEAIAALGCRTVVDLRQPREWEGPGRAGREALAALAAGGVSRLNLATRDGEALADDDLATAVGVVGPVLEAPRDAPAVYLHCKAGRERTASVVLAAWALRRGTTVRAALIEIQRADPRLDPLPWQVAAVESFVARARAARRS